MPQAPGHPATAMIEVHGGGFGNHTETTLGALLVDAFGEGVVEAIQELTDKKYKEIMEKRAAAAKADAERVAKEDEATRKEEETAKAAAVKKEKEAKASAK